MDFDEEITAPPLSGLRVVELGQLIAGPFCGQILGDFGADVIKVERMDGGDPMRNWGEIIDGKSLSWAVISRNKRSIKADLHSKTGQLLVSSLIQSADVLIENFRPGTFDKFGFDDQSLLTLNPRLIVVRISGFGQTGPDRDLPGYGSIGEAMGGLRYLTGDSDRVPSRIGVSIGDMLAGLHGVVGALLALLARDRDGIGQVVDVSIYESVLAVMEALVADYQLAGVTHERSGSVLPGIAPSNIYDTADGGVLVAANQDSVFGRLAVALNRPEWIKDTRFATHVARGIHQTELDEEISMFTRGKSSDELIKLFRVNGVPVGKLFTASEMLKDPQFQARKSIVEVPDDVLGLVPMQNTFPKLSRTPGSVRWPGPSLNEHENEILTELNQIKPTARSHKKNKRKVQT